MPKYKNKSKVKRGQSLQNYWQIRKEQKSHPHLNTSVPETQKPFNIAIDEGSSAPDISLQEDELPDLNIEEENLEEERKTISGRRIVDIEFFFSKIEISCHGTINCGIQCMKLAGEKRVGLTSKFTFECLMCKEKFYISNISGDLDINTAAVAGAVSVGIGFLQLEELLSAIDLPIMTEPLFQKRHEIVSNTWEKKQNHNWYYQVQKQLHVTRKMNCLFGVWFSESKPQKTEIIDKDDDFFDKKMKTKLGNFYLNCILPEILDPRHNRGMEIRNPLYILEAMKNKEARKKNVPNVQQPKDCSPQESLRVSTPSYHHLSNQPVRGFLFRL